MLDAVEDKWHGQRDASRAFGERAWSPLTSRLANLLGPPRATSARPVLRTLPITVACILAPEAALFLPKKTVSMFATTFAEIATRALLGRRSCRAYPKYGIAAVMRATLERRNASTMIISSIR